MSDLKVIFLFQWFKNPYQDLLIDHLKNLGIQVEYGSYSGTIFLPTAFRQWKPDVLHLHSLYHFFLSPSILKSLIKLVMSLCQLLILKLMGVKIVWTAHDLKEHENRYPKLERLFTTLFARLSHAIIAHSETGKQEVIKAFGLRKNDNIFVIPHGNYIDYYENKIDRAEARKSLGIPDESLVLLFFGLIRPYKGVPELINAFKKFHHDKVQLIIAGQVSTNELFESIKENTVNYDNIKFISGFIANNKIQFYMNACDVVVLPYRDIFTSGSLVLAMSFGRACIVPRRGCISDIVDDSGAFLYDPSIEEGLLQAINHMLQKKADLLQMGEYNRHLAEHWSWNSIAEMTFDVYQWLYCKNFSVAELKDDLCRKMNSFISQVMQ